jgi:hypothetical protein
MNKKNQLLNAAESHYRSLLDRYTLSISNIVERGEASGDKDLDQLIDNIQKYTNILSQYNFIQRLKAQSPKEEENAN